MYTFNKIDNTITYKNKIISKDKMLEVINKFIDKLKNDFINEFNSIKTNNNGNLNDAIAILKKIHILKANIAALELNINLNDTYFEIISKVLAKQLFSGISLDNVIYGLKHLANKSNTLTDNQLKESLRKYSNSGNISYHKIKQQFYTNNPEYKYSQRYLAVNDNCPDCIFYASLGKRLIGELPVPGENCQCNTNCKCIIAYYN